MRLSNASLAVLFIIRNKRLNAGYTLVFLLGVVAVLVLYGNRNSNFAIKGTTEIATVITTGNPINTWQFDSGNVFSFESGIESLELSNDSFLVFQPGSEIQISVHSENDVNTMVIAAKNDDVTAVVTTPEHVLELTGYVDLSITITEPIILPFEGKALIGEDIGEGVDSILLSGEISVSESRFLSSGRYQGEVHTLNPGDRVFVTGTGENNAVSKGFLRIENDETFYFSVISEGDEAKITRFGSEDLIITPSLWSRVTKDPVVAAMTSLFALLFLLLEFTLLLNKTINRKD